MRITKIKEGNCSERKSQLSLLKRKIRKINLWVVSLIILFILGSKYIFFDKMIFFKILNNSNIIALLLKITNALSIDQYRHIVMANFKFKIISKIIADKLAQIMSIIISPKQMRFNGRDYT